MDFLPSKPKERYSRYSSSQAAVHVRFSLLFDSLVFVYTMRRTLRVGSKTWIFCSRDKHNISRVSAANEFLSCSFFESLPSNPKFIFFYYYWIQRIAHGKIFLSNHNRETIVGKATCGKSVSSNQKSVVKMNQSVRNTFTRLFNLHSQKFLEFPQVYTSFLAN